MFQELSRCLPCRAIRILCRSPNWRECSLDTGCYAGDVLGSAWLALA